MTHILVECPELIASVRVGVLNALAPLEQKEFCVVKFLETRKVKKRDLAWCDVLICVRGCEEMSFRIVKEAKRLERFLIYFLDDDLLHLPEDTQAYEYFCDETHQMCVKQILGCCDVLWGVNRLIRDGYINFCGKQRWICTRVPALLKENCKESKLLKTINILYAGSQDHTGIVQQFIVPAVKRVLALRKDICFTFIGADPGIRTEQVTYVPYFQNYKAYRAYVENNQFDIGLAPVHLNHFYQCKYYNKFVEYTSVGVVGIYTDCPLYQQIIKNEKNGILCGNTPEEWANAILYLSENTKIRYMCLKNALELVKMEFNAVDVAADLAKQLPEIQKFRAPEKKCYEIHLPNVFVEFYLERIKYLFRIYGVVAPVVIGWKAWKKIIRYFIEKGRSTC